ncbi:NADH-quinone oxidoreductase subunit C [Arenimonas sp. MALMAid1274]|uniref:NADH-quinone oxidoreductase subunit C n=1 Tax=Arenimonas sp. MALMAid1274 TaxID=3411630 RepID=UPI003B9F4779
MVEPTTSFTERLRARLQDRVVSVREALGETTVELTPEGWLEGARLLRDDADLHFESLIDLCGVDFLGYGEDEWDTTDVSSEGFSRGVEGAGPGRFNWADRPRGNGPERRFAVVAHLLSVKHNRRVRLRCFASDNSLPVVASLVDVFPVANWFERECFDLFGILFEGHPDLRRILTDYGFVGHPFRKDFPLTGNVEVRYDAERKRVVYEPVSIDPRVGVPRVVREDSRWEQAATEHPRKDPATP